MGSTSTILLVVVIGAVIYMLFTKAERTISNVNRSVKQTYDKGTAAAAVITNAAPALGTFLGKLAASYGSDDDAPYDRSSSAYYDDALAEPGFASEGDY